MQDHLPGDVVELPVVGRGLGAQQGGCVDAVQLQAGVDVADGLPGPAAPGWAAGGIEPGGASVTGDVPALAAVKTAPILRVTARASASRRAPTA